MKSRRARAGEGESERGTAANAAICLACGDVLALDATSCAACGGAIGERCACCGQPVQSAFRFCPGCGSARGAVASGAALDATFRRLSEQMPAGLAEKVLASRGQIEGERRLVTVLFCDLVGSATIAEAMDPEDYRDLLDRYLAVVFEAVHGWEGVVNQIAGDGVMALFGAPVAHEDAPERALRAALSIRDGVCDLSAIEVRERGRAIEVRVGVHTGPVIVGTVGDDRKMDYTAIGDTTNLAARLQGMARPGTVLVSEATQRLVDASLRLRPLGRLAVRGKVEPVSAFELEGLAADGRGSASTSAPSVGPFVGRSAELAALRASFDRARAGAGGIVTIVGDVGVGKSRLLGELCSWAIPHATVLRSQCFSYEQGTPYRPFVSMLRVHLGLHETRQDEATERLATAVRGCHEDHATALRLLSRVLGVAADEDGVSSDEEAAGTSLDALARLVLAQRAERMLVVALEDVDWLDEASTELLRVLVRRTPATAVLIACTHRPDFTPPWSDGAGHAVAVALAPLEAPQAAEIIAAIVGGPPPPALVEAIHARAVGNPYFTEELARELLTSGVVVETPNGPAITRELQSLEVPVTVREIVAARLDRLDPEARRTLQIAAVVGRRFSAEVLTDLLASERIDVPACLERLERARAVRRTAEHGDELEFHQPLAQEVAYESLLYRQRRRLHQAVGRTLERRHGEGRSPASAQIAFHFRSAKMPDRAVHHLLQAAAHAETIPSYAAAADLYRQAWEMSLAAGTTDEALARQALLAGLQLLGIGAIFGEVKPTTIEALGAEIEPLLARVGTAEDRVVATTFTGLLRMMGAAEQLGSALEQLERALALAEKQGLAVWRWRALRGLATGYAMDGRFAEAEFLAESVLAEVVAEEDGRFSPDVFLWARATRDLVLVYRDDLERARRETAETFRLASERQNRSIQVSLAGQLAEMRFMQGDVEEARAWASRGLGVADAVHARGGVAHLASIAVLSSESPTASEVEAHLRQIEENVGWTSGAFQSLRFVVTAFLAAGDLDRAERMAQHVRRRAGGRLRQALSAAALGEVATRRGASEWRRAEYFFEESVRVAREIGARSVLASALRGYGELHRLRGEPDLSRAAFGEASALESALGMHAARAHVESLGNRGGTP